MSDAEAAKTAKRGQPAWQAPAPAQAGTGLRLYNSLTRTKEPFHPKDGRRVKWYSCGPTVYDASHMGHARSYITFDILRRVLQDYFKYDVLYVMNITDVEDKIILRARRNHLLQQYREAGHPGEKIIADVADATAKLEEKIPTVEDKDKQEMFKGQLAKIKSAQANVEAGTATPEALLDVAADAVGEQLDKAHGSEVTDHSIFTKLTQKWEASYHEDMAALNILPADIVTRVTEYVPQIVEFVQKIIGNGYAYESNASVYFDTAAFATSPDHDYGKLVPEAVGDMAALAEGEGALAASGDKRSESDFALWKASKPGEPAWDSPWGRGRPGWHIECSVMASDILGPNMDIHTGGVDLKFPHHDNEIAQSEACFNCNQWVNYFLHSGHLDIEGKKMSKSLKNFITIKEALETYSARQIRIMFLNHSWSARLDYSKGSMEEAIQTEKLYDEFFLNVKAAVRAHSPTAFTKWSQIDKDLSKSFRAAKAGVHDALCDNIDTVTALKQTRKMVLQVNLYLAACETEKRQPQTGLLQQMAAWLTNLFKMFGVIPEKQAIGYPVGGKQAALEDAVMPELLAFADMREKIRKLALELKEKSVLALCDRVRDDVLPELGVRLEDKEAGPVVKLVDREVLMRERQRELERKAEKARKKAEQEAAKAAKAAAKLEQMKIPPGELFRGSDEYSKFDDRGVPTHDKAGEELPKSRKKKLEKLFAAQDRDHKKYLAQNAASEDAGGATK